MKLLLTLQCTESATRQSPFKSEYRSDNHECSETATATTTATAAAAATTTATRNESTKLNVRVNATAGWIGVESHRDWRHDTCLGTPDAVHAIRTIAKSANDTRSWARARSRTRSSAQSGWNWRRRRRVNTANAKSTTNGNAEWSTRIGLSGSTYRPSSTA